MHTPGTRHRSSQNWMILFVRRVWRLSVIYSVCWFAFSIICTFSNENFRFCTNLTYHRQSNRDSQLSKLTTPPALKYYVIYPQPNFMVTCACVWMFFFRVSARKRIQFAQISSTCSRTMNGVRQQQSMSLATWNARSAVLREKQWQNVKR